MTGLLTLASDSVGIAESYDEAHERDGRRRPAYARLSRLVGFDPLAPPTQMLERLGSRPLGDDTRVVPLALALDDREYRCEIQAGVRQRADALRRFFVDSVLRESRYLRSGTAFTPSLLDEIAASEGTSRERLRATWSGQEADQVRFTYAADLVRDSRGRWLVLEDNVGCVGGCADCYVLLDAYRRATGIAPPPEERPDLGVAFETWLSHRGTTARADGVIALLSDVPAPPGLPNLDEASRRTNLAEQIGMRVVDEAQFEQLCSDGKSGRSPLTAVANLGTPSTSVAERLLKVAFAKPHVAFLNPPGTGLLGNKALLPFVPDFIRFYLGEEPLLVSPTTSLLRDGALPPDPASWVIKTAAGCQGTGVVILRNQTRADLPALGARLAGSWPARGAVAQRYIEPSRIAADGATGFAVELRAFAYALGDEPVFPGEQAIAKLVARDSTSRLHNISRGAAYAPVIRVPGPP